MGLTKAHLGSAGEATGELFNGSWLPLSRAVFLLVPHFPQPLWGHSLLIMWHLGLSLPSGPKVSCGSCVWERLLQNHEVWG